MVTLNVADRVKPVISLKGTDPFNSVSIINGGADVNYVPTADYCGADSFSYTLSSGSTATVNVTVDCVNDAPDFSLISEVFMDVDNAMPEMVACAFDMGPGDENNSQNIAQISVNVVSDPDGVLSSAQVVNSGEWSAVYTGAHGSATVDITVQDDGGTSNGGVDSSTRQMTIHVRDYIHRDGFEAMPGRQ